MSTEFCTRCLHKLADKPNALKAWTSLCQLQERYSAIIALTTPPDVIDMAIRDLEMGGYLLSTDHAEMVLIICGSTDDGVYCANPDEHE